MELTIAALLATGVVALLVVLSYNRFVAQTAGVDASWAGIDVELQRRHDLVDNLVAVARAHAAHERSVFDEVVRARSRAHQARPDDVPRRVQERAEDALTDVLTRLLALSEDHPELRADATFQRLTRKLVETEDRIAAARRLYNIEVAAYERRRRAVPSNVVAHACSFGPRDLFEIRDPAASHASIVAW